MQNQKKMPPARVVQFVERLRYWLRSIVSKMVPPPVAALDFVNGMWSFHIVYALCELKVPDLIAKGFCSSNAIAKELSAQEEGIYRVLRAASLIGVVKERPGKIFELTPIGRELCENALGSARDFVVFQGRFAVKHWSVLKDSILNGKSAIENLYHESTFEYFVGRPEVVEVFNKAMTGLSALAIDAILAAFPFGNYKTIADLAGGHGRLLGAILRAHPNSRGVLIDLPEVARDAPAVLKEFNVLERCEVISADFFKPLTSFSADVILMKLIIHDWDDTKAQQILSNARSALKPGGIIVLCEAVVPGINQPGFGKLLDIEMLVHTEGKERTKEEYAELFTKSGLRLQRVIPTAGPMSLVVAELA